MTQTQLRNWIVDSIGEVAAEDCEESEIEQVATEIMERIGVYTDDLIDRIKNAIADAYYCDEE